ncbi:MAG: VWA domain-containing protein [Rhodospirillaceae bacterium]
MAEDANLPVGEGGRIGVEAFLRQVAATPLRVRSPGGRGRLVFAMDATASRQPTWDHASQLQGEMFETTVALGGLDIQLVYFRGYRECRAGPWLSCAPDLLRLMAKVQCLAGQTQWLRVFGHAISETKREKVGALICVGDAFEESVDDVGALAGELGLLGVPAFMFHEGQDAEARRAFQFLARLSGGAYCQFDRAGARQLRDLLSAVAVFAAGGRAALDDFSNGRGGLARLLTDQMGSGR